MAKNKIDGEVVDYPRVTVTWADHYSDYEQGYSLEDIEKLVKTPCIRKSTGYLLPTKNKRQIAIAGTIDDDNTFCEIFICMKKAIIEIEYLNPLGKLDQS